MVEKVSAVVRCFFERIIKSIRYHQQTHFNQAFQAALSRDEAYEQVRQLLSVSYDYPVNLFARLRPDDFCRLLDEFPEKKGIIIRWSISWAQGRSPKIDPAHKFFEIFQALMQHKEAISGGRASSLDTASYAIPAQFSNGNEYCAQVSSFLYIIYSLIGFQELTRPECREWMLKIDNGAPSYDVNPAYQFGRALSKIFIYPTGTIDIKNKIQGVVDSLWVAYETAKDLGDLEAFFREAFGQENCFDARINKFQKFVAEHSLYQRDFSPQLNGTECIKERTLEHFRVFQNQRLFRFVGETHTHTYKDLKSWMEKYGDVFIVDAIDNFSADQVRQFSEAIQTFYRDWCRPEDFAEYLAQHGHPLRTAATSFSGPAHILGRFGTATQPGWQGILERDGLLPDRWASAE